MALSLVGFASLFLLTFVDTILSLSPFSKNAASHGTLWDGVKARLRRSLGGRDCQEPGKAIQGFPFV